MSTILLLLQNSASEQFPVEALQDSDFFVVLSGTDETASLLNRHDRSNTLVVTDSENVARTASENHFPLIGYEHDGIRLSCSEIIDSLEALTQEYCREELLVQTGRMPVYADDTINLFPVSEDDFLTAYEHFREEPHMLTDEQRSLDRSGVIALYRNRQALAQFTESVGSFRAESRGNTVGYGSLYTENGVAPIRMTVVFYVIPEYRRMGYGAAIVRALIAISRTDASSRDLFAVVRPANTASVRTLKACGFSLIETVAPDGTVTPCPSHALPETPPAPASHCPGHAPGLSESQAPSLYVYCLRGRR